YSTPLLLPVRSMSSKISRPVSPRRRLREGRTACPSRALPARPLDPESTERSLGRGPCRGSAPARTWPGAGGAAFAFTGRGGAGGWGWRGGGGRVAEEAEHCELTRVGQHVRGPGAGRDDLLVGRLDRDAPHRRRGVVWQEIDPVPVVAERRIQAAVGVDPGEYG